MKRGDGEGSHGKLGRAGYNRSSELGFPEALDKHTLGT